VPLAPIPIPTKDGIWNQIKVDREENTIGRIGDLRRNNLIKKYKVNLETRYITLCAIWDKYIIIFYAKIGVECW
jgi:hypothetical protein